MSVSAASAGYSDPNAFVPVFSSENATAAAEQKAKEQGKHLSVFAEGDDEPSFWDLLDVINPLQHIPIVNEIYQEMTGDKIGVAARLAGGALFGGPIGLAGSAVGCIIEESTGDSLSGHALALFRDDAESDTKLAQAEAAPKPDIAAAETPAPQAAAEAAAPPVTIAANTPAPTIATGAPMMFNAEGMVTPVATAATTVSQPVSQPAVTPAASETTARATTAAPIPLTHPGRNNRVMPVPARTVSTAEQAPPPIAVPIASGSSRSNVPITGRNPSSVSHTAVDPLAVQKAMALQGLDANTQHPMLQAKADAAAGSADWMQSMNQALDKYQKAGNLAARPETPASPAY